MVSLLNTRIGHVFTARIICTRTDSYVETGLVNYDPVHDIPNLYVEISSVSYEIGSLCSNNCCLHRWGRQFQVILKHHIV